MFSVKIKKFIIILIMLYISFNIKLNINADNVPGAPSAKRILVIGTLPSQMVLYELRNSPAWQVCYTTPPGTGYHDGPSNTVTNLASWPAPGTIDIANYDQVWDMRFDQAACSDPNPTCAQSLTAAQQAELRNFMQQGGTVF